MTPGQIQGLWTLLYIILTVGGCLLIWFLVVLGIWLPIKKRDEHIKEIESQKKELQEIQAAKGVEWDRYKEQQDEFDRLKKAHFQLKDENTKIKEETAKLKIDKENLINYQKELKKQQKEAQEKEQL